MAFRRAAVESYAPRHAPSAGLCLVYPLGNSYHNFHSRMFPSPSEIGSSGGSKYIMYHHSRNLHKWKCFICNFAGIIISAPKICSRNLRKQVHVICEWYIKRRRRCASLRVKETDYSSSPALTARTSDCHMGCPMLSTSATSTQLWLDSSSSPQKLRSAPSWSVFVYLSTYHSRRGSHISIS